MPCYIPGFHGNGRVQPRCRAQRSNVGCNPVLGGMVSQFQLVDFHIRQGIGGAF
jgi:hypothetical protein